MKRIGSCQQCGQCCHTLCGVGHAPKGWRQSGPVVRTVNGVAMALHACAFLTVNNLCALHDTEKSDKCKAYPCEHVKLHPGCGYSFISEDERPKPDAGT